MSFMAQKENKKQSNLDDERRMKSDKTLQPEMKRKRMREQLNNLRTMQRRG